MTLEEAKKELIRRYKFLYENSVLILAPFMEERAINKLKFTTKSKLAMEILKEVNKTIVFLKINPELIPLFEEFLLSDKKMEETALYIMLENCRYERYYLEKVRRGYLLIEKENKKNNCLKISLSIFDILNKTWDYISDQTGDLDNKENKLKVLDEYYRLARYQNDGVIRSSGHTPSIRDYNNIPVTLYEDEPSRDIDDIGLVNNKFIETVATSFHLNSNWSIFTEEEKQQVYLEYHFELPWDLKVKCDNLDTCGKTFFVKEEEIFMDEFNNFYQLCPICGSLVKIDNDLLIEVVKARIEDRCMQDPNLFRKMSLYSELKKLDNMSGKNQIRVLNKKY